MLSHLQLFQRLRINVANALTSNHVALSIAFTSTVTNAVLVDARVALLAVVGAFGTLVWSITHALTGLLLTGATSLALIFSTFNSVALGPLTCFTKVFSTTVADTLKFTILLHLSAFSTVVASRW